MSALPPKTPATTVAPFSDALGYRVLGFDKKSGDRLEMLRLRPQLAASPAFETAARERQRRLADFRQPAFARIRQIDRPAGQTQALAIVSNYADGQRLSDFLRQAQTAGVALELVVGMCLLQQLVAAVAQLHAVGADIAHGALNPERLVVTPAGRIAVTEYVVGAGLGALNLTPQQAWQDYRLALPVDGTELFTQAADIYQLGYLGLTLVSGRSLYDRQYPAPFATLLNQAQEITADGRPQPLHPAIVSWLTRALRLGGPFATAVDAQAALDEAIASAGLVATPDVVADLYARATGEPETEPATMISMPAPQLEAPAPAPAPMAPEMPAPVDAAAIEPPMAAEATPWTPPAPEPQQTVQAHDSGAHRAHDSGAHRAHDSGSRQAALTTPTAVDAPVAEAAPAADLDLSLRAHAPEPEPESEPGPMPAHAPGTDLPPAQAWTPKKDTHDTHREKAISKPTPTVFHHDETHADEAKGGSSKLMLIGGGVAALAAAAAVVVFVVKPFGGAAAPAAAAAPTAAVATAEGTLAVTSTPQARVFVDDAPRGTTPLRLSLAPGVHKVRLEADNGISKSLDVNVVSGKEVSQTVELTKNAERMDRNAAAAAALATAETGLAAPAPGFMTVDAPEDLTLVEDGNILGSSQGGKVSLAPGSHLIEFRNDGLGFQTTRTVQVLPGKTTRVSIPLPEGNLSINATPWAEVTLDGQALGETPIANVTARAGSHELVFRHPQHGELKQTVVVKAGELGRVTVNMVR
jgi:hypothetical protein